MNPVCKLAKKPGISRPAPTSLHRRGLQIPREQTLGRPLSWRDKRRIWAGTPKRQTQIVQMYPPGVPWSNGGTTPQASVLGLARPAN